MEKDIILINGGPGSGKSRLCRSLTQELWSEMSIEHLSTGDRVRSIGRGVIDSIYAEEIREHLNSSTPRQLLPREIIATVINEAFAEYGSTEHILLDGAPRTIDQLHDLTRIAQRNGRTITGAIVTTINDDKAVERMVARGPRDYEESVSPEYAHERVALHHANFSPVLEEMKKKDLPVRIIDTTGLRVDTNDAGLEALRDIFSGPHSSDSHAA